MCIRDRVYTYSMKNGKPFFDRNIFPIEDMNAEKYTCLLYTSKCIYVALSFAIKGRETADSDIVIYLSLIHIYKSFCATRRASEE